MQSKPHTGRIFPNLNALNDLFEAGVKSGAGTLYKNKDFENKNF